MNIAIEKVWGKHNQDRWGVVVVIENKGHIFRFMPTYKEVAKMYNKLEEAERLNERKKAYIRG